MAETGNTPATTPAAALSGGAGLSARQVQVRSLIQALGMLPVLIILAVAFHYLTDQRFFSGQNVSIVAQQAAINTVLGAGMTFVILTCGIDLSVGSVLAASAMSALIFSLVPDLGWLGVTKAGELRRWSKAQASAYLGRAGKGVMPYLFGPHRTLLGRYTPAPRAALGVTFDEPQCEPAVLHPALERLCLDLALELGNKAASRLSVRAVCQGLEHRASRLSKTLLRRPGELYRLALLTLDDTKAQPLGIEALTLELSGLSRPSVQGGLWPRKERLEHAVAAVENRFPKAVLRLVEDDPFALASDRRVRLVVRATGEEVGRETLDDPGERLNERKRAPLRA